MSKYEKLNTAIPVDNNWKLEDIDKKAKGLGMDRNQLVLKAVDMMMNFDDQFLTYIEKYSKGLKLPEWLVIQNLIMARIADKEALKEVFGPTGEVLKEFTQVEDDKGARTLTGQELKKLLKDEYIKKYKAELEEAQAKREYKL